MIYINLSICHITRKVFWMYLSEMANICRQRAGKLKIPDMCLVFLIFAAEAVRKFRWEFSGRRLTQYVLDTEILYSLIQTLGFGYRIIFLHRF